MKALQAIEGSLRRQNGLITLAHFARGHVVYSILVIVQ